VTEPVYGSSDSGGLPVCGCVMWLNEGQVKVELCFGSRVWSLLLRSSVSNMALSVTMLLP
jgi:hypothetical protein